MKQSLKQLKHMMKDCRRKVEGYQKEGLEDTLEMRDHRQLYSNLSIER